MAQAQGTEHSGGGQDGPADSTLSLYFPLTEEKPQALAQCHREPLTVTGRGVGMVAML